MFFLAEGQEWCLNDTFSEIFPSTTMRLMRLLFPESQLYHFENGYRIYLSSFVTDVSSLQKLLKMIDWGLVNTLAVLLGVNHGCLAWIEISPITPDSILIHIWSSPSLNSSSAHRYLWDLVWKISGEEDSVYLNLVGIHSH